MKRIVVNCRWVVLHVAVGVGDARIGAVETAATLQLTVDEAVRRAIENNPDLAIVRLRNAGRGGSRVARAKAPTRRCFRRSSAVEQRRRRRRTSCSASGESTPTTCSRRPVCGSGCRGARGTWNVSWDTSRTTSNSPLTSFDPALQSGFQLAFSQPLLKDRKMDLARQQTIVAQRNLRKLRAASCASL